MFKTSFIFSAMFLSAPMVFAETQTIVVRCTPANEVTINRFSLEGAFTVNEDLKAEGVVSFTRTLRGPQSPAENFHEAKVVGTVKVYAAGELYSKEVLSVQVATAEESAQRFNLMLDVAHPTSSTLKVQDIFYKAQCSRIQ
ncbi:MAG: hypothetical protein AAGB31_14870 [Bdellovibrio sp.]